MSGWERVDADASVPRRSAVSASGTASPPALRMKRSRNPVVAAFDQGGRVFRRRLRDVVLGASAILVPAVALNLWVTIVLTDRFDPNTASAPLFDDASTGTEDVGVLLAAVFVSFTTAVVGHFAAQLLIGDTFARPVGASGAFVNTVKKVPALAVLWTLTHWWFVLLAAIVVTASAALISVVVFVVAPILLVAASATLLAVPSMVAEGLGPFRAAVRSWRLARRRFGTCLGFVILSTLFATLFGLGITTMIPLLDQFGFLRFGDAAPPVLAVMAQFAVLFVVPLTALATARFYVEMRVSAEGLDLTIDAATAFASTTPSELAR